MTDTPPVKSAAPKGKDAPAASPASSGASGPSGRQIAVSAAVGIGSAAIVAALMFVRRGKGS